MYFKLAGLRTASLDWRIGLITLVSCQIQEVPRVPPVEKSSNSACYLFIYLYYPFIYFDGPGSSVGIVTDYGLDGPGSNPDGDEIFRPSTPALGPTQPPVQWVLGLSRG